MPVILTKSGFDVFAPLDGSANPRGASMAEAQTWAYEIEQANSNLVIPHALASAVFAAMTVQPTNARKLIINTMVESLVTVWAKLDALHVFAAHDAQAALLNWIDPAGTAGTAVNSPTFTADRGYTGDGATSYIDTGLVLNALTNYQLDSASMFVWSLTGTVSNTQSIGAASAETYIRPRAGTGLMWTRANDGAAQTVAVAGAAGLSAFSRGAAANYDRYKDGASLGAATETSTSIATGNLFALRSVASYSPYQIAAIGAGSFLTSGENAALYNALNTYLTALGAV